MVQPSNLCTFSKRNLVMELLVTYIYTQHRYVLWMMLFLVNSQGGYIKCFCSSALFLALPTSTTTKISNILLSSLRKRCLILFLMQKAKRKRHVGEAICMSQQVLNGNDNANSKPAVTKQFKQQMDGAATTMAMTVKETTE